MKTCRDCKQELPTSEFWRRSASRDGLQPACRGCMAARKRRYQQAPGAADRAKASRRRYDRENPWRWAVQDWVRHAVASGRLRRPERCPECRREVFVCAFFPSLEAGMVWRCRSCIQKSLAL